MFEGKSGYISVYRIWEESGAEKEIQVLELLDTNILLTMPGR